MIDTWNIITEKKDTSNNYNNIFTVMGTLESSQCFPLNIGVNNILNYHKIYLLSKCRKKAIAINKTVGAGVLSLKLQIIVKNSMIFQVFLPI